ncbi:MAG: ImmA/IrrE family metallo-endopeptidase [Bacteroidales bacterium]|nr:ImmA/IrrE family metallo-endopeptidase [Bacteroidales bacterium]
MKAALLNIVENQASRFRQTVGLSDTEAVNLKSLLLKLNVLTLYRPLSDDFAGMSLRSGERRFMMINSNNPRGRQHFTIAHELYHLFIESNPQPHICRLDSKKDEAEQCADAFALLFLMPANGVRQLIPDSELINGEISIATILKIEQYFSVSHRATLNRLCDLKFISKEQKDKLSQMPVTHTAKLYGYNTDLYAKANENLVIGDFGEKARKLFENGKISEGHYLELLHKIGITGNED